MGNGTTMNWTGGHLSDITVNLTNRSFMFASTLTFTRNMSGSDINVGNTCGLSWLSGPVNVTDPAKNSNISIASGGTFAISSNATWGATAPVSPPARSYFAVHNDGRVWSNNTATIVGDYDTRGVTQILSGVLTIAGRAEQFGGTFELTNNATVTVSGPDIALRIYGGSIVGTGTVNANLTLGTAGGGQSSGYISPGIDTIPAAPGAVPNVYGIGTITIVGGFQIFSGGMTIDIGAGGSYDKVIVQGTRAALSGSLFVRNDSKYKPAQETQLAFLTGPAFIGDFSFKLFSDSTGWTDQTNGQTYGSKVWNTGSSYIVWWFKMMGPM